MGRVLLLDPEPGERLVLRSRLGEAGHEVVHVDAVGDALEALRERRPRAVLVAVVPGRSGVEDVRTVASALGREREEVGVCALLHDAPGPDEVAALLEAGCDHVVGREQLEAIVPIVAASLRERSRVGSLVERLADVRAELAACRDALDARRPENDAGGARLEPLAGRPQGTLVVGHDGVVRAADAGARRIFGTRVTGRPLGVVAHGTSLAAFVRDADHGPRAGHAFELPALRDRPARRLLATVVPVSASSASQPPDRVVLLVDARRTAALARPDRDAFDDTCLDVLEDLARRRCSLAALPRGSAAGRALAERLEAIAPTFRAASLVGAEGSGRATLARGLLLAGGAGGGWSELDAGAPGAAAEVEGLRGDAREGNALLVRSVERLAPADQRALAEWAGAADRRLVVTSAVGPRELERTLACALAPNVVAVPPLADRRADLASLARAILADVGIHDADPSVLEALRAYDWPGDVAELRAVLLDAVARAREEGARLGPTHLPAFLAEAARDVVPAIARAELPPWAITEDDPLDAAHYERKRLARALDQADGNRGRAADLLGISKSTLYRKLAELGEE